MPNPFSKKKRELLPGTIVKCESGRYVAFYEHRTDIIANGENEKDALKNLREMYKIVLKAEEEEKEEEKKSFVLPKHFNITHFSDKVKGV